MKPTTEAFLGAWLLGTLCSQHSTSASLLGCLIGTCALMHAQWREDARQ